MKKILKIIGTIVLIWCVVFAVDFIKTTQTMTLPAFALLSEGEKDGGSGTYKGIFYTIEIDGNLMPEEDQEVTDVVFRLLDFKLSETHE